MYWTSVDYWSFIDSKSLSSTRASTSQIMSCTRASGSLVVVLGISSSACRGLLVVIGFGATNSSVSGMVEESSETWKALQETEDMMMILMMLAFFLCSEYLSLFWYDCFPKNVWDDNTPMSTGGSYFCVCCLLGGTFKRGYWFGLDGSFLSKCLGIIRGILMDEVL